MVYSRAIRMALCGVAMVAAGAMYALACSPSPPRPTAIQLQSLTIDGVEQTDLAQYQEGTSFIYPTNINARPNSINLSYVGKYGETYDPK